MPKTKNSGNDAAVKAAGPRAVKRRRIDKSSNSRTSDTAQTISTTGENGIHLVNDRHLAGKSAGDGSSNSALAFTSGQKGEQSKASTMNDMLIPLELQHLKVKHNFLAVSVVSSSKMEQKVNSVVAFLGGNAGEEPRSSNVVYLCSKAAVASKMVAIVEIAKQALIRPDLKLWQYSSVEGSIQTMKRKEIGAQSERRGPADVPSTGSKQGQQIDEDSITGLSGAQIRGTQNRTFDEEEVFFETSSNTQRAPAVDFPKRVRNLPILSIYLSNTRISELKARYG